MTDDQKAALRIALNKVLWDLNDAVAAVQGVKAPCVDDGWSFHTAVGELVLLKAEFEQLQKEMIASGTL